MSVVGTSRLVRFVFATILAIGLGLGDILGLTTAEGLFNVNEVASISSGENPPLSPSSHDSLLWCSEMVDGPWKEDWK